MKIQFVNKPLNHRLWTLIFLLSMWAGCEIRATRADETQPTAKQWLDTRDTVEDRGDQQDRLWRMIYAKEETKEISPAPSKAGSEVQSRRNSNRRFRRKLTAAQSKQASRLAYPVRSTLTRRSYKTSYASPSGQRPMHRATRALSLRGQS